MKAAVALALIFLCFWNCHVKAANKKPILTGVWDCQSVRGVVKCEDPENKTQHDNTTGVVIRLSIVNQGSWYDKSYASQNGQFEVFVCHDGLVDQWQIDILHSCKDNKKRHHLKVTIPKDASPEYNIPTAIDLKAHFDDEAETLESSRLPCVNSWQIS